MGLEGRVGCVEAPEEATPWEVVFGKRLGEQIVGFPNPVKVVRFPKLYGDTSVPRNRRVFKSSHRVYTINQARFYSWLNFLGRVYSDVFVGNLGKLQPGNNK